MSFTDLFDLIELLNSLLRLNAIDNLDVSLSTAFILLLWLLLLPTVIMLLLEEVALVTVFDCCWDIILNISSWSFKSHGEQYWDSSESVPGLFVKVVFEFTADVGNWGVVAGVEDVDVVDVIAVAGESEKLAAGLWSFERFKQGWPWPKSEGTLIYWAQKLL